MILAAVVLGAALVAGLTARRIGPPAGGERAGRAPTGRGPARRAVGAARAWWGRRRRRTRAALVVGGLVAGLVLAGAPASAQTFDCRAAPDPDRPGTGLVGSLDPAPIGTGAPGSAYAEVGYAGQIWWTYDLGCGPGGARDPAAATDTWLGNEIFDVAKLIVGGVNWAHYLIARGSGLLAPLDGVVQAGARAMYDAVFTVWAGIALAALAVILLVLAARGDLSRQTQRAGVAVLALAIAAAAYAAPVSWSRMLDGVLLDGVTAMQQGFLAPGGGGDPNTLPTVLTDQIVYTTWLRGEFGSADTPQARDLGRDLLRAQAFTKQEVATGQDGAAAVDAKKAQFTDVAGRVGDRYSYFQGRSGSRVGAGVLALVQAACIGLFQLMSKLLVLVSLLIVRLLVMVAPALAVLALLKPEVLPSMVKIGGAALVNTLLVGAMAGLHALMVVSLFRPGSGVDTWLALLVTGVVTVVLWAVSRPFRRLASMVSLTRDQVGGLLPAAGTGVLGRAVARWRGDDGRPDPLDPRRAGWGPGTVRPEETARAGASSDPVPSRTAAAPPLRVDGEVVRDRPTRREVTPPPRALPASPGPVPADDGALYRPSGPARTARTEAAAGRPTATGGTDVGSPRLYRSVDRVGAVTRAGRPRADPD